MATRQAVQGLFLPKRYQKGLVKMFTGNSACGMPIPFYYSTTVLREGQPVKPVIGSPDMIVGAAPGVSDGAKVIGLSLQYTYDESQWDPQLRGYHFVNNTHQRLDGSPVGVLMGAGYAMTINYAGTINYGDKGYIGQSGYLANSGQAGDALPIVFEGSGTDGSTMVRIRFNFPLA